MRENFEDWGDEAMGEGLTRTWTGILSTVKDFVPLVGEVPGARGVSLVAGVSLAGVDRADLLSLQVTACRESSLLREDTRTL